MIDKYLKTLLKDNKRVIIPDFGGFVVKRTSSGDVVSFNGFLKFNDDLLATHVSEGEGVDKDQAMHLIREEVEHINVVLDEKGSFQIKKLGFLVKDRKGNVRFMDKLEVASVETKDVKVDDDKSQKPENDKEDKTISSTPNSALEIAEDDSNNDVDPSSDVDTTPVVDSSSDVPAAKKGNRAVSGKNKYLIPLIVVVVIIFFVVTWFLFLKPKLVDELKQNQEVVVSEMVDDIIEGDDLEKVSVWKRISAVFKRDSTRDIEEVDEDVTEENIEVASNDIVSSNVEFAMLPLTEDTLSGIYILADKNISVKGEERYNIIIGAFKEHKNAVALSKALRSDNYGAQIFDRYNGFEAVSLGGFPSLDIALRVSGENIKKYPDLWILVK